jgi:hypothetical protein
MAADSRVKERVVMPSLKTIVNGVLLSALLGGAPAYADDPGATPGDPGVWRQHHYSFEFLGFTSTYSCDGLASKLKLLLLAAGARADAKSTPGVCASGFGRPDKFARADLTFYTLVPASEAKDGDGAPVGGRWSLEDLTDQHPHELGRGDCELVEQFRTNVLPMFTTRQVDDHTTCIPHQESGSNIDLKFESFTVPAKPPKPS